MNILHLRYVVEVERTNSITKAAQNLFMGQPNLSKAIKELENEIGITIFKRTAKGAIPTPKGKEFLSYAKTILSQIDELESLYKHEEEKGIEFAVSSPRSTYISLTFADFINKYQKEDKINARFWESSSMRSINNVVSGASDIGIIRYQSIYEDYFLSQIRGYKLSAEPITSFKMCLLMSKNHPLATKKEIAYHDLDGFVEIVHGDFQTPSVDVSKINRPAELLNQPKRVFVFDRGSQYNMLQRIEGSYMWISPMPKGIPEQSGFVQLPCINSELLNKDVALFRKGIRLNKYAKSFLDMLKESAKQFKEE